MPRAKFIAGNWKMFTAAQAGRDLAAAVAKGFAGNTHARVAVCPPFPYLSLIAGVLQGSPIGLGAQNCYPAIEGAYTGEVSPVMLKDVGCRYVIVGHSERRHGLGESDDFINRKAKAAFAAGLDVILCIGETLDERKAEKTESILDRQLAGGLQGIGADVVDRLTLAYEPVWAIGTGADAAPQQAQDAHAFIRKKCAALLGPDAAARLTIQYGGSVKPDNAADILTQPDVDGALVGGASLKADSFLAIVAAARA